MRRWRMSKPSLDELERDIQALRGRADPKPKTTSQAGYAFRVGTELISGVAVGCVIGYGVDAAFESSPWGIFIGSMFGFAAGMRLMIETAKQAGDALEEEEQNAGDS